jgi:glutamate synthase (NADPH/NADH) small chain
MGVKIQLNTVVGKTVTLEQLRQRGFKAFLLATGAGLPLFMGIPGENACGVYSANEYLTRIILMGAWDFPNNDTPVFAGKKVVVVGAGNTAMDAMRSSRRLPWVEEVWCVYRRSRQEAPARIEELEHAEQEGVNFQFLTLPLQILMTEDHWVRGLRCQRMELGEPDEKGRRKPVPIEGSEFEIECDTVVYAIGQRPNPVMMRSIPGLEITKWGTVAVDDELKTNIEGVFAAGDIISGASTVIMAVGQGKRAARSIDRYLSGVRSGNPTWEPVYAEAVAVT